MELKLTPRKYRILGALVDCAINFCAIVLILLVTSSIDIIKIIMQNQSIASINVSIINLIFAGLLIEVYLIIYLVFVPLYNHGATIGQRMFHMAMVNEDGTDCNFETLFMRQVVGNTLILFSTFAIGWFVSLCCMFYRKDNATIADIIGKTYVVDRK